MPGACGFFSWYDEPVQMRSKVVINGLIRRSNNLERERDQEPEVEASLCHNNFSCIINFSDIFVV